MNFICTSGRTVPVDIRRRKGTRHLRLSLGRDNQVVASVPWHTSDQRVAAFIDKQSAWLEMQLSRAPEVYSLSEWLDLHPQLTASGRRFELRIEKTDQRKAEYCFEEEGAVLVLRLPKMDESSLLTLVRAFAKDGLSCRVAHHAKRLELHYTALSVRDQSSRWGSCSARRAISLNWRLVLLRPVLQDYVILHELAHLSVMNHSKRFWDLLDQYDPKRVAHEAELNRISAGLMRVG